MELNFKSLAGQYQSAQPFPHIIIDDAFKFEDDDCPDLAIELMHDSFPKPDEAWWKYDNALERKWAKNRNLPSFIDAAIDYFNSFVFISALEEITGIPNLIADHTLNGGGLHQITRGGKLDIHEDYNIHPLTGLDRRVNMLLYLNKDWKPDWKGNLEFWNADMTECVESIEPLFNRMVIFSTVPDANHGHPHPLECPDDVTRKSIAMYYYTNGRPTNEVRPRHSTMFKKRPQDPEDPKLDWLRLKRSGGRI